MDAGDRERGRGVAIMAKNTALFYRGDRNIIVDAPPPQRFLRRACATHKRACSTRFPSVNSGFLSP
jgi:hypothetical protein